MNEKPKILRCYKLTTQEQTTLNDTKWEPRKWHDCGVAGFRRGMCMRGGFHAYTSPYIAALLNTQHASIIDPLLWRAEARGAVNLDGDHGRKIKVQALRVIGQPIPMPTLTTHQMMYGYLLLRIAYTRACGYVSYDKRQLLKLFREFTSAPTENDAREVIRTNRHTYGLLFRDTANWYLGRLEPQTCRDRMFAMLSLKLYEGACRYDIKKHAAMLFKWSPKWQS